MDESASLLGAQTRKVRPEEFVGLIFFVERFSIKPLIFILNILIPPEDLMQLQLYKLLRNTKCLCYCP